jgi:hypothetical protein
MAQILGKEKVVATTNGAALVAIPADKLGRVKGLLIQPVDGDIRLSTDGTNVDDSDLIINSGDMLSWGLWTALDTDGNAARFNLLRFGRDIGGVANVNVVIFYVGS